jgi:hypothetical protein
MYMHNYHCHLATAHLKLNKLYYFFKLEYSRNITEVLSNTKHHENPSSGSRLVRCWRTDRQTDWQTHMTKPIFAFRNSSDAFNKIDRGMDVKKLVPEEICICSATEGLHLNSSTSHIFSSHPDVAVSSKSLSFQQNHSAPADNLANGATRTFGQLLCQWLILLASIWSTRLWNMSAHEREFPRMQ